MLSLRADNSAKRLIADGVTKAWLLSGIFVFICCVLLTFKLNKRLWK